MCTFRIYDSNIARKGDDGTRCEYILSRASELGFKFDVTLASTT
jgi:hypothetical protein